MVGSRKRSAKNEFQARLLHLEKLRGMKPSHVARAAGMSLVYYQEIWSKERVPSMEMVLRIARAFGEDPGELVMLAERVRAPEEARGFFHPPSGARFPALRERAIRLSGRSEGLMEGMRGDSFPLLERWLYCTIFVHYSAYLRPLPEASGFFKKTMRAVEGELSELRGEGGYPLVSLLRRMEDVLSSEGVHEEYLSFLEVGLSGLEYGDYSVSFQDVWTEPGSEARERRYHLISDPRPLSVISMKGAPPRTSAVEEPFPSYDPEALRRETLYSPDIEGMSDGLKDLIYDEEIFNALRVTPDELHYLKEVSIRGYGGRPLKDAYIFVLNQYRSQRRQGVTLSEEEERLLSLFRELNRQGREQVIFYLQFTHEKDPFREDAAKKGREDLAG